MQEQSEKTNLSRERRKLFVLLGFVYLGLIAFTFTFNTINHDATVFLDIGSRILEGSKPYIDFFEVNPPLIHYLHVIPVLFSKWLPLSPVIAFNFFILLLTIYSSLMTLYVLWKAFGDNEMVFNFSLAILLAIFGLFIVRDYGQREHLFLLLAMPFYLLRWQRWQGSSYNYLVALVVGFFAGIGMLIKPYFIVMLAVTELYWLIQKRKAQNLFSGEVIGAILAGIAYILFFVFNPDIRNAFFNVVTPQLVAGYNAYNTASIALHLPVLIVIVVAIILSLAVETIRKDQISSLLFPSALFGLVCLWSVYSQGKGWEYHYIPYQFIGLLCLLILFWRFVAQQQGRKRQIYTFIFYIFLIYFTGLGILRVSFQYYLQVVNNPNTTVEYLQTKTQPDDSILFIGTSVNPAYPNLLLANRRNANAYIMAHPIVFAADSFASYEEFLASSLENLPNDIANYLSTIEENINDYQPRLIGIAAYCEFCDHPMNLHEYLSAIGFIDEAVLPNYQYSELWDNMYIYEYACPGTANLEQAANDCIQERGKHD